MHRIIVEAEKHKPKRSMWPSLQCLVTKHMETLLNQTVDFTSRKFWSL